MWDDPPGMAEEIDWIADVGVRIRFWTCPMREHGKRRDANGWPALTVDWRGDVAHCTAPGCGRTSRDAVGQEVPE